MNPDWTRFQFPQGYLNNSLLSDIKFSFEDGRIIFAHSFILSARSSKFYNSFVSNIGISKLIPVHDSTYEEYFEFLSHVYMERIQIDETTVVGVMKLATKYLLPKLEKQCVEKLIVTVNNACIIVHNISSLDSPGMDEIGQKAVNFLVENYLECLNHKSFLEVSQRALAILLKFKPDFTHEFKIFKILINWATQACLKDGNVVTGKTKSAKLGDNLKIIRFGAMTMEEFGKCHELEPYLLKGLGIYESLKAAKRLYPSRELNDARDPSDLRFFTIQHPITRERIKLIDLSQFEGFTLQKLMYDEYFQTCYDDNSTRYPPGVRRDVPHRLIVHLRSQKTLTYEFSIRELEYGTGHGEMAVTWDTPHNGKEFIFRI